MKTPGLVAGSFFGIRHRLYVSPARRYCSLQKGMSATKQLAPVCVRIQASAIPVTSLKLRVKQLQKTKHDFSSAASREAGMSNLLLFMQLIQ